MSNFFSAHIHHLLLAIIAIALFVNAWVGWHIFRDDKKVQPTEVIIDDIEKQYGYDHYEAYTYAHYYNMLNAMELKNRHWTNFYAKNWWQYVINRNEVSKEKAEEIIKKAQRDFEKLNPSY